MCDPAHPSAYHKGEQPLSAVPLCISYYLFYEP